MAAGLLQGCGSDSRGAVRYAELYEGRTIGSQERALAGETCKRMSEQPVDFQNSSTMFKVTERLAAQYDVDPIPVRFAFEDACPELSDAVLAKDGPAASLSTLPKQSTSSPSITSEGATPTPRSREELGSDDSVLHQNGMWAGVDSQTLREMSEVVCAQIGMGYSLDQVKANFRNEISPADYSPSDAEVSAVVNYATRQVCRG